jgi:hypothetical protein
LCSDHKASSDYSFDYMITSEAMAVQYHSRQLGNSHGKTGSFNLA